jgi:hypothetical protein
MSHHRRRRKLARYIMGYSTFPGLLCPRGASCPDCRRMWRLTMRTGGQAARPGACSGDSCNARQNTQVAHGGSAMWAVPRGVQVSQVLEDALHDGLVQSLADHDAGPAGSHRQHCPNPAQARAAASTSCARARLTAWASPRGCSSAEHRHSSRCCPVRGFSGLCTAIGVSRRTAATLP